MTDDTATILDVAMGSFSKYNAHLEYSEHDVLLKLVRESSGGRLSGVQQPVSALLDSISAPITSGMRTEIFSFLDLLLVRTDEFLLKYLDWLKKLAALNARVLELESIASRGKGMRLHRGLVVHSATADSENRMREQFGGRWRRIMNFPLLVPNARIDDVGKRGGESFVSLMGDNVPNHRHGLEAHGTSSGDRWKDNVSGTHPFISGKKPGLSWSSKTVYPEISSLNWNQDIDGLTSGAARYVKPHFNIPPYKDVYIWECVDTNGAEGEGSQFVPVVTEIQTPSPSESQPPSAQAVPFGELASRSEPLDVMFDDIVPIPASVTGAIASSNPGVCLPALSGFETFMSDSLASESSVRYDSKDAPVPDLVDLIDWHVWCEVMHVEKRYLFKDAFAYLLEDVQDRIYLLMKRLLAAMGRMDEIPQRVFKGQYVFLKGTPEGMTEQQTLDRYYRLPRGLSFVKVSNVFLRGTSMFTEETKSMFSDYVLMDSNKEENFGRLTTGGGLSSVNLYSENFPKHLHWSTLLVGLTSASVEKSASESTGGAGSDMMMNDPRSGGLKHGTRNGTGPYRVTVRNYGSTSAIPHNNIPKYVTMSVYLVS